MYFNCKKIVAEALKGADKSSEPDFVVPAVLRFITKLYAHELQHLLDLNDSNRQIIDQRFSRAIKHTPYIAHALNTLGFIYLASNSPNPETYAIISATVGLNINLGVFYIDKFRGPTELRARRAEKSVDTYPNLFSVTTQ